MSATQMELEILSMTVDAISLAISQQQLSDSVKEEVKVPTQPISDVVIVEENTGKIVTCQPESHQEDGLEPTVPKAMREDQEGPQMNRHKENLKILRKFLKVNQGNSEGVFFSSSFPSEEREVEERVKKMATRLAMVSIREWMLSLGDCYGSFGKRLFKTVAKLIMNLYDLEDLERFNSKNELLAECNKFCVENLLHLKSGDDPYKLVAKGKIKFDGFPLLGEQDIGDILKSYCRQITLGRVQFKFIPVVRKMNFGLDNILEHCCFKEECHGHFVEMARTVLLQYVPLEDNIKMHSMLECLVCDCRCTVNGFLHDAVSDVVGKRTKEELRVDELTRKIEFYLSRITNERISRLSHVSFPAANFVVFGHSGTSFYRSFAKEVHQLVKIANARRRLQCQRFISKHHILWAAVQFTIYNASINHLVKDLGLGDLVEVPAARRPPYNVYLSAQAIADRHRKKLVRIEHVVAAIVYEMCKVGGHKIDLKEFTEKDCVTKFFLAVKDTRKRSSDSTIFVKFDAEIVGDKKEGKIATQNSFHCLESEILSMTVDAISLAISQQVIIQELADAFKEDVKVPFQPISDMVLVVKNGGKIVTTEAGSHQGDGVKPTLPEIASVNYARHEENLLILAKFFNSSREKKGGSEGVFFSTDIIRVEEREVEERVKKMATRLAMVSLREWMLSGVDGPLEKIWGDCGSFVEESFKGVAKLILNAYDMEDLERFNSIDMLSAEYKRFYDENLSHLKPNENPYKLVAKGKMKFEGFPLLREQDVGYLLQWYSRQVANGKVQSDFIGSVWLMSFGFHLLDGSSHCFKEGCHDHLVEIARTVLLHYVQLEEDIKMHTILDGLVCNCGGPLKGFIHDVFNVVGIREVEMDKIDKYTWTIFDDLDSIARERLVMLGCSSYPAASFVEYDPSGTFSSYDAKEVSRLVQIADARRRFQKRCFISKHHILWAAAKFTIYKDLIYNLLENLLLRILDEGPAASRPPYSVYTSARATAEYHGAKLVGVEHIVVAIVYEMCKGGRHKKDLEEFNNIKPIREFLHAAKECKERSGDSSIFRIKTELLGTENVEVMFMSSRPRTNIPVDHMFNRIISHYEFMGPLKRTVQGKSDSNRRVGEREGRKGNPKIKVMTEGLGKRRVEEKKRVKVRLDSGGLVIHGM